jgi:hypothetical protein
MEVKCAIQFMEQLADGHAVEAKAFFADRGWQNAGGGSFTYSLEAEIGGVDGPSLAMHKKIRELYAPEGTFLDAFPVTVLVTAGGRQMFSEPAAFGRVGNTWGMRISETEPPYFDDILRLRDKTIATLAAISKGQ